LYSKACRGGVIVEEDLTPPVPEQIFLSARPLVRSSDLGLRSRPASRSAHLEVSPQRSARPTLGPDEISPVACTSSWRLCEAIEESLSPAYGSRTRSLPPSK
ncbi:unnamed protein product, partial [Polarella glacialis]